MDQKKKRGRPPTGRGMMVSSRIQPAIVGEIDQWAARNETTRSDAIRRLVELGLTTETSNRMRRGAYKRARELSARAIEKLVDPAVPPEELALLKVKK